MGVLNKMKEELSSYQSTIETEKKWFIVDGSTTETVRKTRTRRIRNTTTKYSGGCKAAALAKKDELEAIEGMGELYLCQDCNTDEWTLTATLKTTGAWKGWKE